MQNKENNIAYIDAANLYHGARSIRVALDYIRLRVWLKEKLGIQTAYLFIGLVSKNSNLYVMLQKAGYVLVFKETTVDGEGTPKGNCDADLVLRSVRDVFETSYDKAVIVSSDGDYASLVQFLIDKDKMRMVVSPSNKCSLLLRKTGVSIVFLRDIKTLVESRDEKAPDADGTA